MKTAPSLFLAYMCVCLVKGAPPKQQESLNSFEYDTDSFEDPFYKQDFEDEPNEAIPKKGKGVLALPQRDEPTADSPATSDADLPTCLLCVCLSGSVYCEETEIDSIPPLPKETAYLYARFNKIKKVTVKDFADIPTLKRIDLSGNVIEDIEDGAFAKLNLLEQLSLADNKLTKLPTLPVNLTSFNANNNKIKSKTIKANTFKKMNNLSYLYLAQNALESVPPNLPESLRILHLQSANEALKTLEMPEDVCSYREKAYKFSHSVNVCNGTAVFCLVSAMMAAARHAYVLNNITSINDDTFCKSNNTRYVRTKMDEVRMEGNPVILGKYPNSFTCLKMLPIGSYF